LKIQPANKTGEAVLNHPNQACKPNSKGFTRKYNYTDGFGCAKVTVARLLSKKCIQNEYQPL